VDNLCKTIEFKHELNQHGDMQRSQDDMEKTLATAAAKSPYQTRVMARGRITDQASPPEKCNQASTPASSPARHSQAS
jgi:hypothetical protein